MSFRQIFRTQTLKILQVKSSIHDVIIYADRFVLILLKNSPFRRKGPGHQNIFPQKRTFSNLVWRMASEENGVPRFRGGFRVAEFFNRIGSNLPFAGTAPTHAPASPPARAPRLGLARRCRARAASGARRASCRTARSPSVVLFVDGRELARFEHTLPAKGTGQRLYQRAARMQGIIGHLPFLAAAALHEVEWDVHSRRFRHSLRAGDAAVPRSASPSPLRTRICSPTKEWLGAFKATQTQMLSGEFTFSRKHAELVLYEK
jgi:hypothetical protein